MKAQFVLRGWLDNATFAQVGWRYLDLGGCFADARRLLECYARMEVLEVATLRVVHRERRRLGAGAWPRVPACRAEQGNY